MNQSHQHTDSCLGSNELGEICCGQQEVDRLVNSDRFVVTYSDASTINVFTDTLEDAFALAVAHRPNMKAIYATPDPQPDPYT